MGKNDAPYVDLHVHTWFSDSTLSPEAVVAEAVKNGVGLLAVADHEGFAGSEEALYLCARAGIRLIPAAEIECTQEGRQYHVLSLGVDLHNVPLRALAARNRALLDGMSDILITRMKGEYPRLSAEDFAAFKPDRLMGGWKGLQYLLARGVTSSLREGMPLYARYGIDYAQAGFPCLSNVVNAIHGAGGRAVLAHPGYTLRDLSTADMLRALSALFDAGLDGLECRYPTYTPEITRALTDFCRTRDAMRTAGSDCHGTFGRTRVGEMDVTPEQIDLKGLV